MFQVQSLEVGSKSLLGLKVELGKAPLVLIVAPKGFVMCSYLNMETAEALGDAACLVKGVRDPQEMLEKELVAVSSRAKELGISEGMKVREALVRLV